MGAIDYNDDLPDEPIDFDVGEVTVRGKRPVILRTKRMRHGIKAMVMEDTEYGPCELSASDTTPERALEKLQLFAAFCERFPGRCFEAVTLEQLRQEIA